MECPSILFKVDLCCWLGFTQMDCPSGHNEHSKMELKDVMYGLGLCMASGVCKGVPRVTWILSSKVHCVKQS